MKEEYYSKGISYTNQLVLLTGCMISAIMVLKSAVYILEHSLYNNLGLVMFDLVAVLLVAGYTVYVFALKQSYVKRIFYRSKIEAKLPFKKVVFYLDEVESISYKKKNDIYLTVTGKFGTVRLVVDNPEMVKYKMLREIEDFDNAVRIMGEKFKREEEEKRSKNNMENS